MRILVLTGILWVWIWAMDGIPSPLMKTLTLTLMKEDGSYSVSGLATVRSPPWGEVDQQRVVGDSATELKVPMFFKSTLRINPICHEPVVREVFATPLTESRLTVLVEPVPGGRHQEINHLVCPALASEDRQNRPRIIAMLQSSAVADWLDEAVSSDSVIVFTTDLSWETTLKAAGRAFLTRRPWSMGIAFPEGAAQVLSLEFARTQGFECGWLTAASRDGSRVGGEFFTEGRQEWTRTEASIEECRKIRFRRP